MDARVLVYGSDITEDKLPKLAIRPYPTQYVSTWTTKSNTQITIRPILPEDEPFLAKFHATLSDRTVFMRYLQPIMFTDRVLHERLARICHCDYDREIALVAEDKDANGEQRILGVGRLSKVHGADEARLRVLVGDPFQGMGIGSQLVRKVIEVAKGENLHLLDAVITPDNMVMQHLFQKLGFSLEKTSDGKLLIAKIEL